MDLDYAIWNDEPQAITETSTPDEVALYKRWERCNRLSVMLIKAKIYAGICGCVDQHDNVRALLKAIDELFASSGKALGITLLWKFSSMKFTGMRGVREHIMEMCHIAARLKPCGVEMAESFLVQHVLNTLPEQYDLLKISYNISKDKWSINELIAICVGEEELRLMRQGEGSESEHGKNRAQPKHEGKGKIPAQAHIKKEYKCFFCKKKGHLKQDCMKFHQWLEKKGNLISLFCYV